MRDVTLPQNRALVSAKIEDIFKDIIDQAIDERDTDIRQQTLGKEKARGCPVKLPAGSIIARKHEVLQVWKHVNKPPNTTFLYLCSSPQGQLVVIKIAKQHVLKDPTFRTVCRELLVWRELEKFLPTMFYFNQPLIEPKLDPRALSFRALSFNFEQLMDKFVVLPIGLCLLAAADTLVALKSLHDVGFVHRNVHPRHFCLGMKEGGTAKNLVYLIDLSRAERFVSFDSDGEVPRFDFEPDLVYSTTDVIEGKQHTRRDDLLSWLYTLIAFRNSNYWRKYTGDQQAALKDEFDEDKLAVGFGPSVGPLIAAMLYYLRQLKPYRKPDYAFLMQCIVTGLKAFCNGNLPPSLPENPLHFWKLHKYKSELDSEEAFEARYKIINQDSCFSYLDENPEKVSSNDMQHRINRWFQHLTKESHLKMFNIIESRMKVPEKGFPSLMDNIDVDKLKELTKEACENDEEVSMLPPVRLTNPQKKKGKKGKKKSKGHKKSAMKSAGNNSAMKDATDEDSE